jgi:hypothetical protein
VNSPSGFLFGTAIAIAKEKGGISASLQILLIAKANNPYSRYEFLPVFVSIAS